MKNKIIPSYYYESDGSNGIDAFEGLHNDIADGISNICIKYHYKYITSILILQTTFPYIKFESASTYWVL